MYETIIRKMPGKRRLVPDANQPTLKVFFGRKGCPSPPLDFSRESNPPLLVVNPPAQVEQMLLALGAQVYPADHWKTTIEVVDLTLEEEEGYPPSSPSAPAYWEEDLNPHREPDE